MDACKFCAYHVKKLDLLKLIDKKTFWLCDHGVYIYR